ncbi:MAG: phosphate signaling complex protein PhoU [Anaerolineales bacterium]|nr:phosphate signaling complex protein PhoU [Anaerolineales bacterium]MCB8953242.1 phosphate signaling complex protein PhoU [Ardenticatenales bacterium]
MITRQNFDRDLQHVQDDVLSLGSMVEGALIDAVQVLRRRDMAGSRRLVEWDRRVNEKRFAIESNVLSLIARQQPVARDMRTLAAVLEIVTELERIGDYAKGIARINTALDHDFPHEAYMGTLTDMAQVASRMVHQSLEAFAWRDVALARQIPEQDDLVDEGYKEIYRALIAAIMKNPGITDNANSILWAAHNLERSADRAVNICERVVFTVTGEMVELSGA